MIDRPRLFEPVATLRRATPFSLCVAGPVAAGAPEAAAPLRLLLPPRLIVPVSVTVKRSLWLFRAPRLNLLKD